VILWVCLFFPLPGKSRQLLTLYLLKQLLIFSFCSSLPLLFPKQTSQKNTVTNMETSEYPKGKQDS